MTNLKKTLVNLLENLANYNEDKLVEIYNDYSGEEKLYPMSELDEVFSCASEFSEAVDTDRWYYNDDYFSTDGRSCCSADLDGFVDYNNLADDIINDTATLTLFTPYEVAEAAFDAAWEEGDLTAEIASNDDLKEVFIVELEKRIIQLKEQIAKETLDPDCDDISDLCNELESLVKESLDATIRYDEETNKKEQPKFSRLKPEEAFALSQVKQGLLLCKEFGMTLFINGDNIFAVTKGEEMEFVRPNGQSQYDQFEDSNSYIDTKGIFHYVDICEGENIAVRTDKTAD